MKWNYRCPVCTEWRRIDWEKREKRHTCHKTEKSYMPPGPADQHDAYVDTYNWPKEMEDVVVQLKGKTCTAIGCGKPYETLDHHIPWSGGGRTSVENLTPMCNKHNQEKSDKDPDEWMLDRIFNEID